MQAKKLASGTILRGEYVLLGVIGDGNSNVFRAHHRRDNRLVAVRIQQLEPSVITPHTLDLPNRVLKIRDPMLAAVEATGQTKEGFMFIVGEYVAGQRMDQWADKIGIPSLGVITDLVHKVSTALYVLHREGIAHGAVNPRNLVLQRSDSAGSANPTFSAKLLDVGVPAFMRARPPRLRSSYFMAPEQLALLLRGEDAPLQEADSRMDVYGCGCVLYHLCTGGPPFQGRSLGELIAAHTSEKLLPPSRINPRIPAALEAVILRALANDPAERYAHAGDLAAALAEIRRTSSVSGVVLRPPVPSIREPRDSPVDLGEIFGDFPSERPTSQVQLEDDSVDTVRPPAGDFDAELTEPQPPMPTASEARSSSPGRLSPPPVPNLPSPRPSPAPPAAAPTLEELDRVAERSETQPAARTSVPAGSFTSAPPAAPTNRLSDPFRPARPISRSPLSTPVPQSSRREHQRAPDTLPEVERMKRPFARFVRLDRSWLALPAAAALVVLGYFVLREPEDTVSVSSLETPSAAAPTRPALAAAPETHAPAPALPAAPPPSSPARARATVEERPVTPPPSPPPPPWHPIPIKAPAGSRSHATATKSAPASPLKVPQAFKQLEVTPEPTAANEAPAGPIEASHELALEPEPPPTPPARAVAAPEPAPEPKPIAAQLPEAEPPAKPAPKLEVKPHPVVLAANAQVVDLNVRGSLTSGEVRRALEHVQSGFPTCYASAARAAGHNAFGELAVELTIDENGRARKPSANGSPLPGLNACVTQVAGELVSSRKPDTGTVKASFKLSFTPKTP